MQDRFKFRLFDKSINEMSYDVCVGFIKDSPLLTRDWVCADTTCGQINYTDKKLNDIVLMQCTGLKDKNGKLIYEGDIVKAKTEPFMEEEWEMTEPYSHTYIGKIVFENFGFIVNVVEFGDLCTIIAAVLHSGINYKREQ